MPSGESKAQNILVTNAELRERALELAIDFYRGAMVTPEGIEKAAERFVKFMEAMPIEPVTVKGVEAPKMYLGVDFGREGPQYAVGGIEPILAENIRITDTPTAKDDI